MVTHSDRSTLSAASFLEANPGVSTIDAFVTDLNGVLRGKRIPAHQLPKLMDEGIKIPISVIGDDLWGNDVYTNGLVLETGDVDGLCTAVPGRLLPIPWKGGDTAQVSLVMNNADRTPFEADPRHILTRSVARCHGLDLFPTVAFELEFYLFKASDPLGPPEPIGDGTARMYEIGGIDSIETFLGDLRETCRIQSLPMEAIISEGGIGQFEINLHHQADPILAADQAVLFRRAVRGTAAAHGLCASFMAKPYMGQPGSGMHVHVSVADQNSENAFASTAVGGPARLGQAIGGLVRFTPEAMIFFAPHLNSYRRFQSESHAPLSANWGHDNRTTAFRIPADDGANRRIEHRISGADANPYLVLAAILESIAQGVETKMTPPPETTGNGYEATVSDPLPDTWDAALQAFQGGSLFCNQFGAVFTKAYTELKRQEMKTIADRISPFEYLSYLDRF